MFARNRFSLEAKVAIFVKLSDFGFPHFASNKPNGWNLMQKLCFSHLVFSKQIFIGFGWLHNPRWNSVNLIGAKYLIEQIIVGYNWKLETSWVDVCFLESWWWWEQCLLFWEAMISRRAAGKPSFNGNRVDQKSENRDISYQCIEMNKQQTVCMVHVNVRAATQLQLKICQKSTSIYRQTPSTIGLSKIWIECP